MSVKFTRSFKVQAVEKALTRDKEESIEDVAKALGVGFSTLQKWIRLAKDQNLDPPLPEQAQTMMKEKRPQEWSQEERLGMVISCDALSEEDMSKLCREKGLYPHHVRQWKVDFASDKTCGTKAKKQADIKVLKLENRALKKDLTLKNQALAEAAALLVLQKKVTAIWGSDNEDNSQ